MDEKGYSKGGEGVHYNLITYGGLLFRVVNHKLEHLVGIFGLLLFLPRKLLAVSKIPGRKKSMYSSN